MIRDVPWTWVEEDRDDGLVAYGGVLDVPTLDASYRRGIFPWTCDPVPLWFSPDPRMVLFPDAFHRSASQRRRERTAGWTFTLDRDFAAVMRRCRHQVRYGETEARSWIDDDFERAYGAWHRAGKAHSVEVRRADGTLVGGLYGVALGTVFFGESMFSGESGASKAALGRLADFLRAKKFDLIDCQAHTDHLESLGARAIPRAAFLGHLARALASPDWNGPWTPFEAEFNAPPA